MAKAQQPLGSKVNSKFNFNIMLSKPTCRQSQLDLYIFGQKEFDTTPEIEVAKNIDFSR